MNFEKEFYADVAEKKRIARGIHARASRGRGFKGAVRFPSDVLKGKEKRDYCKAGEVRTYMMIPDKEKFFNLDNDGRINMMAGLLKDHNRKAIAEHWGMKKPTLDAHIHRLGLSKPHKERSGLLPLEKPSKKQHPGVDGVTLDFTACGAAIPVQLAALDTLLTRDHVYKVTVSVTRDC